MSSETVWMKDVRSVAGDCAEQWLGAVEIPCPAGTVPPIPTWESWVLECYVGETGRTGDEVELGLYYPDGFTVSPVDVEEAFHTEVLRVIVDAMMDRDLAFVGMS